MTRILLVALAILVVGATPAAAHGKQVRFLGVHPIPKGEGGGICYIEGPHVHIYAAPDKVQYRVHAGVQHFVGDPVAFGYDGPKFAYQGPHPIDDDGAVEWCYLQGPHFHAVAPPPAAPDWQVSGDTYFFVGAPPKEFFDARPTYVKINADYAPLVYARPVVSVEAPAGWIGARVDVIAPVVVAPVVVAPAVVVPSIDIHVPMPSIQIGVGVGVGIGGGVILDEHRGKHDNGRHRGHHK